MLFTMRKIRTVLCILELVVLSVKTVNGQSEGLTSSPYSLYGLGVINSTTMGRSNGMGYTGIGMKSSSEINNLNPSSYALIPKYSFFYDIGVRLAYNTYENRYNSETKTTFNFANLAFAFSVMDDFGIGLSLIPYSDVGYSLLGVQTNIEGSSGTFETNISGLGGLNDLKFNAGYGINSSLRLGFSASYLFGNIDKNESFFIASNSFSLEESINHSGVRLGLGFQYDLLDIFTLGSTVQFPTSLKRTLRRSVLKSLASSTTTVEDGTDNSLSDFKLPLELGFGLSSKFFSTMLINLDYKKNFWSNTNPSEGIGKYKDQNIFGLGLEFVKNEGGIKYGERIRYRTGLNYDSGYLSVNNSKIRGYSISAGIGFPLNFRNNSLINLSYNYGTLGEVETVLIKEKYHLLSLNLNLEDAWFIKRKIN